MTCLLMKQFFATYSLAKGLKFEIDHGSDSAANLQEVEGAEKLGELHCAYATNKIQTEGKLRQVKEPVFFTETMSGKEEDEEDTED